MRYRLATALLAASLLLVCSPSGLSQLTSATLTGNVTDSSGAAIADATVTATSNNTGIKSLAVTDTSGNYVLSGLAPGVYGIEVTKTGFAPYEQTNLVVVVGGQPVVNALLHPGAVSQRVVVEAAAGGVNTRSPGVSTVISNKMAQQLPLNGRNVLQLMQLAPDTGPTQSAIYQQAASRPDQANNYVGASGGRGDSTVYYLDGALNEDALTQIANVYPNPDAIEEFSFDTSTYSARFSGRGGGVMNAVTRGGTNQFHGAAFEFLRNSDLNGRNYFNQKQDGLKRNQFGGAIGGPIRKNRAFAFFSYQGTRIRQNPINSARTLTAAERSGDFSAKSTQMVNPFTGASFPGNQVPTTLFDPIDLKLLALMPIGAPDTGIVQYPSRLIENDNQFVARVDYDPTDKLRMYTSYIYDNLAEPSTAIPGNLLTVSNGLNQMWRSQFAVVNASYIFSPTLTATFVGSLSRRTNLASSLPEFPGWTGLGSNIPSMTPPGHPSLDLTISSYFTAAWNGEYKIPATEGGFASYWTMVRGAQTFEFGGDMLFSKVMKDQDFHSDGYFVFSSERSGDNGLDFLLGAPSTFNQQAPFHIVPTRALPALYLVDTWKALPRLTLTGGVRWNPFVPVFDSDDKMEAIFSPAAFADRVSSAAYPTLAPGLLLAGDPGVPPRVIDSDYKIFDPRVGFAFDIFGNGKSSLRGGFGVYQDQMTANTINPNFSPFNTNVTFTNPIGAIANPYEGQTNPFPLPAGRAPKGTHFQIPMVANPFTLGMKPPTIQEWNLTLQQQVLHSSVMTLGYEGSRGYHLMGSVEGNAAIYNPTETLQQNLANYNIRRPMGQYYQGLALGRNSGITNYNAMIISLRKQAEHGLTFLVGYRWSRCMNESEESFFDADAYSTPNPRADYGPCTYDVRNQVKGSAVWDLPRTHLGSAFANHVLSNWELNAILTLRDGQPFTVGSGVDHSTSGIGKDRADQIGDPHLPANRSKAELTREYFNTAAFTENALGTFGDVRRNSLVGPGYSDLDFSVVRTFRLPLGKEGQLLQFRAESFNLANRVNFNNPTANVASSADGHITSAQDPRILQFALKYSF